MNWAVACSIAAVAIAAPLARAPAADIANATDVVSACTAINHDYAIARDRGDVAMFETLFTEDATFSIAGEDYVGRDSILERLKPGASANFARLLIHTVQIRPEGDDRATGITYFTMFMAADPEVAGPPVDDFVLFMGEYHDRYAITPDGCRFSSRQTRPIFSGNVQ